MGQDNNVNDLWASHASWRSPEVRRREAAALLWGKGRSVPYEKGITMPQPLPHCVYVLRSRKDGDLYVGYTTDLPRRLDEHASGLNRSTAPRRPLDLVFCEFYASSEDAQRREMYLKTSAGKRGLKLMLRETLNFSNLDAKP